MPFRSFAYSSAIPGRCRDPATAPTQLEVSGSLTNGGRFHGFGDVIVQASNTRAIQVASLPGGGVELVVGGSGGTENLPVAIYDVRGRIVKRWIANPGSDGSVTWDGRRTDGQRAAAGVYFVRVRSASGPSAVARVVLAR